MARRRFATRDRIESTLGDGARGRDARAMTKRELRRRVERARGARRAREDGARGDDDGTDGDGDGAAASATTARATVAPSHARKAKRRARFLESASRRERGARARRPTATRGD